MLDCSFQLAPISCNVLYSRLLQLFPASLSSIFDPVIQSLKHPAGLFNNKSHPCRNPLPHCWAIVQCCRKTSSVGCRGLPGQSQHSLPSLAIILLLSHNICRFGRIITPFLDSETVQFWLSLVCQKAHSSNEPEIGNTGSSTVSQFELPLVILSQTCLLRSPPR